MTDFYNLIPSAPAGRFDGIERPYSPDDVERLRGSVQIRYTLAENGANRLWQLIHREDFVNALGAVTGNQAMQQVRAGLGALPRGQRMAGTALGLTLPQTYRYVLLPMAFRVILPPLTSELVNTVKNTSVALTIGLAELTARARAMQEFSFQVFEAFTAATAGYLLVNLLATVLMRWLERRVRVPGYVAA